MTLHHYEGHYGWTDDVNIDRMNEGDVVIAPDPQERLGQHTFSVVEIDDEQAMDRIVQRGLFWKPEEARRYAKSLHNSIHPEY